MSKKKTRAKKVIAAKFSTTKEEFISVLKKVSKKIKPSELSPSKPRT